MSRRIFKKNQTLRAGLILPGALLLGSFGTTACYKYVPVSTEAVEPSEQVRVRVTEPAVVRLAKDFGTYTSQFHGQLAPEGSDSLSITVSVARQYQGTSLDNLKQKLFVARTEIVNVQRRELDRRRTVLATTGVLAAFALAVNAVVQLGDPNPVDDGTLPPPPDGVRVLFRIPIRIR